MREDLLQELENEYALLRSENEREEERRRERIRIEFPEIHELMLQREELVFGTLRSILKHEANEEDLPEKMDRLSRKIRESLEANQLPANYLAPIYRCEKCRDTGKTGEPVKDYCTCFRTAYQQKLREKIGLTGGRPETFEHFDLNLFSTEKLPDENYSQRDLMRVFRDDCRDWADKYPNHPCRDMLLMGKSGLGKTYLLRAMASRLIERNINVLIISAFRMLELLRQSYFENDEEISSELLETDVLMIDDLGSEPMMQNVTIEQLFNLINERQNRGLSTVISTNLDMARFRERYTERIASRLSDIRKSMILVLKGKDIRTAGEAEV